MDWLSARATATPDKTFLHIDGQRLSFAEVNRMVWATCRLIQRRVDLKPGDRVAILLPNGLPYILSVLALMRMCAVSVPLNARLTTEELAWQVENTGCRLVLSDQARIAKLRENSANALEFPAIEELEASPVHGCSDKLDLADDFAIVHTSGTSGRPKAAVLTNGNIYHSAIASAFRLGVLPEDRWLCILPLYHVGGLSIILRSLLYGTAVDMLPSAPFDVERVNRLLTEQPISLVSLVPTMLQRLLDGKMLSWNPRLRLILLGGEATRGELVERCIGQCLPIATSYGLSEASSQVATALPDQLRRKPDSVGKPLLLTQTRIIDEEGEAAPVNVPGEVLVKGPTVLRAYHGDPSATSKALQGGWLHTGDIGYLDDDGDLFILQRRSDLIVSGGENIYPAEVEAVLREHPAVAEALVFGLPDAEWGQRPVAIIQLASGVTVAPDEIVSFARERLAGYKLPRQIAFAEAMPRTASGKIQRKAAPKVFEDAISRQT